MEPPYRSVCSIRKWVYEWDVPAASPSVGARRRVMCPSPLESSNIASTASIRPLFIPSPYCRPAALCSLSSAYCSIWPIGSSSIFFLTFLSVDFYLPVLPPTRLTGSICVSRYRYIKLSSPKLNNIAVIGTVSAQFINSKFKPDELYCLPFQPHCLQVFVYGAVFLLGIDYATLSHDSLYSVVCMVSVHAS